MEDDSENPLYQEVEVLRAIYGEEKISFHACNGSIPATITISLDGLTTQAPSCLTLTSKIPLSYPLTHPQKPTLRSNSFTAAQCESLVDEMMRLQTTSVGVVCLYDWFQGMISVINEQAETGTVDDMVMVEDVSADEERFKIFHGEPLTDRKSVFQAHVGLLTEVAEIDAVLTLLKSLNKKVESATHNTLAYRVNGVHGVVQDVDDDGEKGAGKVVLHVMERFKVVNVVVVVSRWFGGIKLGPMRFRHIAKVVGDALERFKGELEFVGD